MTRSLRWKALFLAGSRGESERSLPGIEGAGNLLLVADIYQKEDLPEQVRENIQRFHLFNPTPEEFRELLENAGFEEVQIHLKDGEDWICAEGHK